MNALAASPFALLDARGSLRLVTDLVHEDDALCLALACRALRDALGARFPACPRAGGRRVASLAARVNADGVLDLSNVSDESDDYNDDSNDDSVDDSNEGDDGGLRTLPEGVGRLAYLPRRPSSGRPRGVCGLRKLNLYGNRDLVALPEGLCTLVGLEELDVHLCGLRALPKGIGGLTGLKKLDLSYNKLALPEGLWSLAGLEELDLGNCGLIALPEEVEGLAGLRVLNLNYNAELTALPEGLCSLAGLEELNLMQCGLRALPEWFGGLAGLRALDLWGNTGLSALPDGFVRLRNLEALDLDHCPALHTLKQLQEREGLPSLLAHLAAQGELAAGAC
jgi:Leucine-rich repeat (LRR) protein